MIRRSFLFSLVGFTTLFRDRKNSLCDLRSRVVRNTRFVDCELMVDEDTVLLNCDCINCKFLYRVDVV